MTSGPTASAPGLRWQFVGLAVVLCSGLFAYWGVWRGDYVFDDAVAIVGNLPLQAGDWWNAAFGPVHQPLANRPLACWSLVADFAVFGAGPFGPHLTNLLLHLGNATLVFGVARGAMLAPNLAPQFDGARATRLAMTIAAVWAAHPLGCDAVGYATQRSTLLASGFLLLALLAALRAHAAARPLGWRSLAVGALACSMASKEDAVVGPVLLVLFERAFLLSSWRALATRRRYYAAAAATWCVLAACVALGPHNPTVGCSTRSAVTAWQWLLTQAGVVARYLQLVGWPHPLRGAYDTGIVTRLGPALLQGAVVLALLWVAVAAWRRRPWLGWLGALFFLWLAPTSTVMPIVSEVAAERRVYLPMLFVLVPGVLLLDHCVVRRLGKVARPLAAASVVVLVVVLGIATQARVLVYRDAVSFWQDAYDKRTPGGRTFLAGLILSNQGDTLVAQGRIEEAGACYDESMQCDGPTANAIARYAVSLLMRQRHGEAVAIMRRLAQTDPSATVFGALGVSLAVAHEADHGKVDDPRLREAEEVLRPAVTAAPHDAQMWSALGYVLMHQDKLVEAEAAYHRVTDELPGEIQPCLMRAALLYRLARPAEVAPLLRSLLALHPRAVPLRLQAATRCAEGGDLALAEAIVREALAIESGNAQASAMLRDLQARRGR